jgi:hypothetical protein
MRVDNMEPPVMRASSRKTKDRPLAPSEPAQLRLGMPVLIHAADRAAILNHSARLRYFLGMRYRRAHSVWSRWRGRRIVLRPCELAPPNTSHKQHRRGSCCAENHSPRFPSLHAFAMRNRGRTRHIQDTRIPAKPAGHQRTAVC